MHEEMTPQELNKYRIKLMRDAHSFNKPERVPINGNAFNWMFTDAGYTFSEAVHDYEIIDKCCERFVKTYKVDGINQFHMGFRNAIGVLDALGGSQVYTNQEGDTMNAVSEDVMLPDEYDELAEDYDKYIWTKCLPRMFPKVKEMSLKEFALASKSFKDWAEAKQRTGMRMQEEYGIVFDAANMFQPAIDALMIYFRGIKGLAMDLRRRPEKVEAFCEKRNAQLIAGVMNVMQQTEGQNPNQPYDTGLVMLAHTILNRKQWEKFYVPYFKQVLDYCEEHDKQAFIFAEGSWECGGSLFNEYSKGTCNVMTEIGDPFEYRRKYPNVCQYGGLDVAVLSAGTPEQCVDMAKKAIDELGRDGGLVLQPNKMVTYPNDMKAENFKAVCDFASEYKIN